MASPGLDNAFIQDRWLAAAFSAKATPRRQRQGRAGRLGCLVACPPLSSLSPSRQSRVVSPYRGELGLGIRGSRCDYTPMTTEPYVWIRRARDRDGASNADSPFPHGVSFKHHTLLHHSPPPSLNPLSVITDRHEASVIR